MTWHQAVSAAAMAILDGEMNRMTEHGSGMRDVHVLFVAACHRIRLAACMEMV